MYSGTIGIGEKGSQYSTGARVLIQHGQVGIHSQGTRCRGQWIQNDEENKVSSLLNCTNKILAEGRPGWSNTTCGIVEAKERGLGILAHLI